jgi:hypothetical protein
MAGLLSSVSLSTVKYFFFSFSVLKHWNMDKAQKLDSPNKRAGDV